MARRHYAKAIVSRPEVSFEAWMDVAKSVHGGVVTKDKLNRVAKSVLRKCDPKQYLLSHATIVASVDTYSPKNVKTGRQFNKGIEIDVRFPDYLVKPECNHLINNNGDWWSRPLLLSTYRTFVGAPIYLEHIQIPELSKGFIVDAIARDLGETVYVDILTATDRKHGKLIDDIASGQLNAYSMGCISQFTVCTKCGNVAADDNSICPCVLYEGKLNKFFDDNGVEHVIGELIGHVSVPDSNVFIEASWVRNPAFAGAVHRNFLNNDILEDPRLAAKAEKASIMHEIKSNTPIPSNMWNRSASVRVAQDDEPETPDEPEIPEDLDSEAPASDDSSISEESSDDSESEESDTPDSESSDDGNESKLDELLDKLQEGMFDSILKRLQDRIAPSPEDVGAVRVVPEPDLFSGNDNLVRSSEEFSRRLISSFPGPSWSYHRKWALAAWQRVHFKNQASELKPSELILLSWVEDRLNGKELSSDVYIIANQVGRIDSYPSDKSYLAACRMLSERKFTASEEGSIIMKGRIASLSKFFNF